MKTTIYVQDIGCEECTRLINKIIKRLQGINSYAFEKDRLTIDFEPSMIKEEAIIIAINSTGYRASNIPVVRMSYSKRAKEFYSNKTKYKTEWTMIKISTISFMLMLLIESAAVLLLGNTKYIPWLLYLTIAVVSTAAGIWHLKAYRTAVPSMTGMMLGMTIGMQSGFMIGAIVGATNGMFVGTMTGVIAGVVLGTYAGKDSGIMGAMQGMMSGLMGGTMGAMTTVMLLADHVNWFMPFFMVINVIIMISMSYMIYEEIAEGKEVKASPADFSIFFAYVFLAVIIIAGIMLFGMKSLIIA